MDSAAAPIADFDMGDSELVETAAITVAAIAAGCVALYVAFRKSTEPCRADGVRGAQ